MYNKKLNKIRDLSDDVSDEIMEEKEDIHSLKIIEEIQPFIFQVSANENLIVDI